jgi:metal-responsive CopG/Arc/MetJ family transcriptional regulator
MPQALLEELKEVSIKNHYLDVSEALRSLLREKWLEEKSPYQAKISEIRKHVSTITDDEKLKAMKKTLRLLEELNEL